ncbi:hypothetical protein C0U44_31390, partial [Klebsiella pneumoniae]
ALRDQLEGPATAMSDQVMEHGEYATRGALLDLFPMGSDQPYRLDLRCAISWRGRLPPCRIR